MMGAWLIIALVLQALSTSRAKCAVGTEVDFEVFVALATDLSGCNDPYSNTDPYVKKIVIAGVTKETTTKSCRVRVLRGIDMGNFPALSEWRPLRLKGG